MTMKVELADLAKRVNDYGFAYLVTVGESSTAHVLAVWPELGPEGLVVDGVGRHSQENAQARSDVTLVWPPTTDGGYSLLVDARPRSTARRSPSPRPKPSSTAPPPAPTAAAPAPTASTSDQEPVLNPGQGHF
jgi:hypothetical protein